MLVIVVNSHGQQAYHSFRHIDQHDRSNHVTLKLGLDSSSSPYCSVLLSLAPVATSCLSSLHLHLRNSRQPPLNLVQRATLPLDPPSPSSRNEQRKPRRPKRQQSELHEKRKRGRRGKQQLVWTMRARTMASCPCTRARRGWVSRQEVV